MKMKTVQKKIQDKENMLLQFIAYEVCYFGTRKENYYE